MVKYPIGHKHCSTINIYVGSRYLIDQSDPKCEQRKELICGGAILGNIPVLGYFLSHGFLSLLFWGVLLALAVVLISKIFGKKPEKVINDDQSDSLEILKMRFAKGEIDKEEFQRMKQILIQP